MRKIILLILCVVLSIFDLSASTFIKNEGQLRSDILYYARLNSYNAAITNKGIIIDKILSVNNNQTSGEAFLLEFAGNIINIEPKFKSENVNIFKKETSYKNIPAFKELICKNVYEGIDIRLYIENESLRFDYILSPNSDLSKAFFLINGGQQISNEKNTLNFNVGTSKFEIRDVKAYQYNDNKKIQKNCELKIKNNKAYFETEKYDKSKPLIIDPLIFSTYAGGSGYDYSRAICLDSSGNSIITGNTMSVNFPVTVGAYDTLYEENTWGFKDIFISKFDSSGQNLLVSTFIGGIGDDMAESIVLDDSLNIYITGYTWSLQSFPVTSGVYDSTENGGYDAFVMKMNPNADSILFSTLIGGIQDDFSMSIAIDSNYNIYFAGYTSSEAAVPFPTVATSYDTSANGKTDIFVAKLSANGKNLIYSTFIGGEGDDYVQSLAVDKLGYAYIGGLTRSRAFPTTNNAFRRSIQDSSLIPQGDGYIVKLSQDGKSLVFSSFIGGADKDAVYSIAVDELDDIYMTGYTESANLPVSANAYDREYNNLNVGGVSGDVFVAKLKHTGDSLRFMSYLGGKGVESPNIIVFDSNKNIIIGGGTNSTNFPVSRFPFDNTYNDTTNRTDAFVTKLNSDASKILYSTYFGGALSDVCHGIALRKTGSIVFTGWTASGNFPVSSLAFDKTANDTNKSDIFLAEIMPNLIEVYSGEDQSICLGDSVRLNAELNGGFGGITVSWKPVTGLSRTDSISVVAFPKITTAYFVTASDTAGNLWRDTVIVYVVPKPLPDISGPYLVETGKTQTYYISPGNQNSYLWYVENGTILSGQGSYRIDIQWADSISKGRIIVSQTNSAGCSAEDTLTVYIGKSYKPVISFTGSLTICEGDTLVFDAGAGFAKYLWSDGSKGQINYVTQAGKYWVFVSDSVGFAGLSDTLEVFTNPVPNPEISGREVVKLNLTYSYSTPANQGSTYNWIANGGSVESGQGTDKAVVRWTNISGGSLIVEETNKYGCTKASVMFNVSIGDIYRPRLRILGTSDICEGDSVLLDGGYGFTKYTWSNGLKTRFITVKKAGTYWAFVEDEYGFKNNTDSVSIAVRPLPLKPVINVSGNLFECSSDSVTYQWFRNDSLIIGANEKTLFVDINGKYHVKIQGKNSCFAQSDKVSYPFSSVKNKDEFVYRIYPNPAQDVLNIYIESVNASNCNVQIFDIQGREIYNGKLLQGINTVHPERFSPGIYYVIIYNGLKVYTDKIIAVM